MMTPSAFRGWLMSASLPALLDGGLSSQLETLSPPSDPSECDPLHTTRFLAENPALLYASHSTFTHAGAEIICTATYQASQETLSAHLHLPLSDAGSLLRTAPPLARRATLAPHPKNLPPIRCRPPLVALALGPYAATLAPGAEYRPYDAEDRAHIAFFHSRRAHVFFPETAPSCTDIVLFETIPDIGEAVAITGMMLTTPSLASPPFMISFVTIGDRLTGGGSLAEAVAAVLEAAGGDEKLVGVGVNCCELHALKASVHVVKNEIKMFEARAVVEGRTIPAVAAVAYPGSGEVWEDGAWVWPGGRVVGVREWAEVLLGSGADIVGGCCRTNAGHIASLQERRSASSGWYGQPV